MIAEINFRRNQLFDTYAAKYSIFTQLALDRGIEKLRNGEDISFKEISAISKGSNQIYFKDVPYRDEDPAYLAIKNYCRDFGIDANELGTLAMRFLEEQYKKKKKTA